MSKKYIFALYVNGKVYRVFDWFCEDEKMMRTQAVGLCAGAKAFKSTAGILVYELRDDKTYHVCHSVDFKSSWFILHDKFPYEWVKQGSILVNMLNSVNPYTPNNNNIITSKL